MSRYNPVAEAIRRRAWTGCCVFCGTPLQEFKKKLVCVNADCVRNDGVRMRLRPGRRRMVPAPPAPSSKAAARAKRRKELGLGRFDPLP